MSGELALDILLDAIKDSAIAFGVILVFEIILSFLKIKMKDALEKHPKIAPLFGSLFGLIPQCGTSVLSADLYLSHHISTGTLVAIFLATSDEAVPLLLTTGNTKALYLIPLLLLKIAIGFVFGFSIDLILHKKEKLDLKEEVDTEDCHHIHHHHEDEEKEKSKVYKHLVHPLLHSLELLAYVFVINIAFGFLIGFVGKENFAAFIETNKYLAPLFSSIVGLIPNCASSVVISTLFINGHLSFGALLSGLLVNAGLGFIVLFKSKKHLKQTLLILLTCFIIAVVSGYVACLISGF